MSLNIICDTQGTEEWFAARIGCLTSSRIADALAKRKRNPEQELQCRIDLKMDLAVERITNKPMEHFVSKWMELGKEREPLARAAYELRTETETTQTGFVLHPSINWAGASPDGFVGDAGLVEFKCPKSSTHAEYRYNGVIPEEYAQQMRWQLACCPGYQWVDFVSYHPDWPEPLDLLIMRMTRDEFRIAEMESEAGNFLGDVEEVMAQLKGGLLGTLEASLEQRA